MSLTAIKDIFHSAEHSWCQLPYWKVQQEASIKTLLLKLFTLYLLFIILIYYLSCFQSVIMPMLILNEARHMNLRAQALPCWNAKAGWVSSSHTQGCAVLYLPLCELGELGHCQLHLALLGARGWCWGLRLNWLRGCPRTCDGFLPSGGRSCAGTRNCCWDRLTPDYLSHHLLGLTCKRRIWAKKHIFSFLIVSTANFQITNCNGVWWWSDRWSKHCSLHINFLYKPFVWLKNVCKIF